VKKENAKENGKRMSQEELDKEIAEMKEQLNVLMMILEENQRLGWVLRKNPVMWHKLQRRLQEKKTQQVNMQLAEELMKLEQVLGVKLRSKELRESELEMEVSICELEQGEVLGEEEGIIDDFLNCWINVDQQQENVKPCIVESNNFDVITGFADDEPSFEVVKRMEEYLLEDKNSDVKEDGEYLLNERSNDLLQQK